jgi:glutathione S-transferase
VLSLTSFVKLYATKLTRDRQDPTSARLPTSSSSRPRRLNVRPPPVLRDTPTHPRVTDAITRYTNETQRVFSVLESVLSKSAGGWLMGDKLTIADLSFITWSALLQSLTSGETLN